MNYKYCNCDVIVLILFNFYFVDISEKLFNDVEI